MHPHEFVRMMIRSGRKEELVGMIGNFALTLFARKNEEHAAVYNFADAFLVSLMGQLLAHEGDDLDDDHFFSVWMSLGFFGIDRDEIKRKLNQ